MAEIRQFNQESMRKIARVVRDSELGGGGTARKSRRKDRGGGSDGVWAKVVTSTVVVADSEWDYTLRPQKGGSITSNHGLQDNGTNTYPGKNTWEDALLVNAGYQNGNVTGLYEIPNGAIVWARLSDVNGEQMLIFSERNEPKCGEE